MMNSIINELIRFGFTPFIARARECLGFIQEMEAIVRGDRTSIQTPLEAALHQTQRIPLNAGHHTCPSRSPANAAGVHSVHFIIYDILS